MLNFTFKNPVKIIFGAGQIAALANEVPENKRILLTYGGGSIKRNGVYDQVIAALKNHTVLEFGGIEPNPTYETLMKAVDIIKKEKIDFVLAVGGGSIADGTKFIVAAANFQGEPWDILAKQAPIESALPFGVVLTLPATGSEMNCGAVISRAETKDKLNFINPAVFPQFSILDPTTTYSLPESQTSNGIVDAFIHVIEQYLTFHVDAPLQDRFSESILQTLVEEAPKVFADPNNYEARANIMWCSTLALNGLIGAGVPQDWATHMIGHELTAMFGLDHGQTLAIILPSIMQIRSHTKGSKILQYGERVFGITEGPDDERIEKIIAKTREFFESLNVKTYLSDYNITKDHIPALLNKLEEHGRVALGEHGDIDLEESKKILENALERS